MAASILAILGIGIVDPATPVIRADDLGLTRGDGCFEGCRVVTGTDGASRVDKLDAHLDRMTRSAAALDIELDRPAWHSLVATAAAAWAGTGPGPGEAAMKLVLTRGCAGSDRPTGLVTISPLPTDYPRQRAEGLKVITLDRGTTHDAFTAAPWLLGGVKTLSYAVNMAAQREAARRGADDALFVSDDGAVLESTTGSVVWSRGRTLHTTPDGGSGILAGTTQRRLFTRATEAGWRTETTSVGLADLHAADVVWLLGSVRGPVDIIELDGQQRARLPAIDREIRRLAGF